MSIVFFWSYGSPLSRSLKNIVDSIPRIRQVCVDSPEIRQALLNSSNIRITVVPCILEVREGQIFQYDGSRAQQFLYMLSPQASVQPTTPLMPSPTPQFRPPIPPQAPPQMQQFPTTMPMQYPQPPMAYPQPPQPQYPQQAQYPQMMQPPQQAQYPQLQPQFPQMQQPGGHIAGTDVSVDTVKPLGFSMAPKTDGSSDPGSQQVTQMSQVQGQMPQQQDPQYYQQTVAQQAQAAAMHYAQQLSPKEEQSKKIIELALAEAARIEQELKQPPRM